MIGSRCTTTFRKLPITRPNTIANVDLQAGGQAAEREAETGREVAGQQTREQTGRSFWHEWKVSLHG